MILTDTGYQAIPTGMQLAALVNIFDLGVSPGIRGGIQECVFLFELAASPEDGPPFLLTKRFPASLGAGSSLRLTLESWRGNALTEAEVKEFNTDILLNINARLKIVKRKWHGVDCYDIDAILPPRGKRTGYKPRTLRSYVPRWVARAIEESDLSARIQRIEASRDRWKAHAYIIAVIAAVELVLLLLMAI